MATQKKVHSEFSMRLNLTFKAGFGADRSDQLMRDLVAFLKLKKAMGSSNSWIKEAILDAFMRERGGVGVGESIAQLGDSCLANDGRQHPDTETQRAPEPRPFASDSVKPANSVQRAAPLEETQTADVFEREALQNDTNYAELLDDTDEQSVLQSEPAPANPLPRSLMSLMG